MTSPRSVGQPNVSPLLPLRNCVGCGQTDDHPRHVVATWDALTNTLAEHTWHMDCHARLNPPCEICTQQIAGSKGATGHDLRAHIVRNAPTLEGVQG